MNLNDCSNYNEVLKRAKHYYGNDVIHILIDLSTSVEWPFHRSGQIMGYLDYTKYIQLYDKKDANIHRNRYLNRALCITLTHQTIYQYYYYGNTNQIC
jgi:hypothetical protein